MASQKTRVSVTIVRSTEKAHLIEAAGRKGWIQKRWLAADSTVSEETFTKAAAGNEQRREEKQQELAALAAERNFRSATHRVRVVKETEKAVAAEVILAAPGGFETPALVWFPKSAIGGGEGVAEVPGWMIREREEQAAERYQPRGYYERHRACKGETTRLLRGVEILADEPAAV